MEEFMACISALMSGTWDLFTGIEVPGLPGMTIAKVAVGVFLATLGLRLVGFLFGFSFGGDGVNGDTPRTSSTKNAKISDERKGDEY